MILDLFFVAVLAMTQPPVVVLAVPCEFLPQPVLILLEATTCSGSLIDYVALKACPPDVIRWIPNASPPFKVTALTYAGPGLPLVSTETAGYGCP